MKTPEARYKEILDNKISLKKGIRLIIHSLQESENDKIIFDSKWIFNNLNIKFKETFNIISNFFRNTQKPITKLIIAKVAIISFSQNCKFLLRDQIQRDTSALFLTQFFRFLITQSSEISKILKSFLIEKYKNIYNINVKESQFFIDLEATQINIVKELDIKAGYFKKFETESIDLLRSTSQFNYVVRDYHIRALDLSRWEFNEIPLSIRFLSELEYLNLSNLKLKSIPESIKDLLNLKYLNLKGNSFIKSPNWLSNLADKLSSKKYLNEGVIPSDISSLTLLEIFLGEKLEKVERKNDVIQWDTALHYKINDRGNVIGIYIKTENSKLGIFPEQICSLIFLEELELPDSSIKYLPDCIGNLKSLKYFNLFSNQLKSIPKTIDNLRKLEYLDLDDNNMSENSLLSLRWYKIGQNYLKNSEFNDAINECRETLKIYPQNKFAWYHLGIAYLEEERYDEAKEAFNTFLEIDESNSLIWSSLSEVYNKKGEYEKAIEAIRHAINIEPNTAVLFSNLGYNYKKLGKYNEATEAYLHSLEIDPKNMYVWRDLASIYREKGEFMKAIEADERAFELELNSNLDIT